MHCEFCVHGISRGMKRRSSGEHVTSVSKYVNDTLFSKEEIYAILVYDIFKECDVFTCK